jgi:hypothetical protein
MKAARMKSPQARWTRDTEKERYWRKQVTLWQESGLSVRAFCKEHGVIETSFYAWRRELIVRARESGSAEQISSAEHVPPNKLEDGRGRSVSIRFRQTDHRALESHIAAADNNSPFVSLKVVADPRGPSVNITLNNNYLEGNQPATFSFSNLGLNWSFNWISYLTVDPVSGTATVRYRGGHSEDYALSGGVYTNSLLILSLLLMLMAEWTIPPPMMAQYV